MQEEHLNRPNTFVGGMNLDDDLHFINPQDYIEAYNVLNTAGALPGAMTNTPGNVEIFNEFTPNDGLNTVIGACEDKRNGVLYYFVYNSKGNHTIYKYNPNDNLSPNLNGSIELVMRAQALQFNIDWKVSHARYIDDKYLYWVDSFSGSNSIEGNPPRKINAVKSSIKNKRLEYEVIAGLPGQDQFATSLVDGNQVVAQVYDRDTNTLLGATVIDSILLNAFIGDPYGFLNQLTIQLNVLNTLLVAEYCEECRIKITMNDASTYLTIYETVPPAPNKNILFIRTNHYPEVIREEHIEVLKYPPRCEPNPIYKVDTNFPANNVNQTIFQFRLRYWYDDGEKSAWGPISIIALPIDRAGEFAENLNTIEIDYTDERLNDPDSLNIIRKVEIGYREGNDGLFRSIDVLDICEIGINKQIYYFRNDKMYSVVASDDVVTSGQTQALKLFDSLPRISGTMETVSDRDGNNRLFYGANLENYDNPDCIDLKWAFDTTPDDECFITIKGKVELNSFPNMQNDGYFRSRQISANVPADPNELVINGFVIYLAGTNYYGISESFKIPAVTTPTGEFEIKNVPRGIYVMRVANWRCRFDNSKGEIYNLNNGIAWQKTSAPVIDCAGSVLAGEAQYERTIDLTLASNVFDLMTEPGYGPILIQNWEIGVTSDAVPFNNAYAGCEFYYLDADADPSTNTKRRGAIGVERQNIFLEGWNGSVFFQYVPLGNFLDGTTFDFSLSSNLVTDHNGYAWTLWLTSMFDPVFINQDLSRIRNVRIGVRDACGNTTRILQWAGIAPNTGYAIYNNGLEALWLNTDVDAGQNGSTNNSLQLAMQALLHNYDEVFTTKNKTIIEGETVENNGIPLKNVLVWYQRNGRPQFTDILGGYSITAYCPFDFDYRDDDKLITTYPTDNCYDYPPNIQEQTPNIANYCTLPYDSTNSYSATTVVYPINGAIVQLFRYVKRGGVYRTGIVYEDRGNRKATVAEGDVLRVPYFTEPGVGFTRASPVWTIYHQPPEWATHYRIVLTNDSYYRRYLQWIINSVQYSIISSVDATPVPTSFSNGDATHVLLELSGLIVDEEPTSNSVEWFFFGTNLNGFSAQPKDRIRFILDETGTLVLNTGIYDFEIVGIYRDGLKYYLVIETPEIFREIKAGWLIEAYTPKKNEEVVFFEMGECHKIIDAGTQFRRHAGPLQNQIVGIQPAEGFLAGGDTYWRIKNYSVGDTVTFNYQVENSSITDRFDSEFSDIGRPNVKDDDFGERFYFNRIRLSGIYIPDSKINGLSAYKAIDFQSLDLKFGTIMKLISADNVLLAVCQNKTQPIYVGKDRILDLTGAGSIGRSDQILNIADELKYDYGTHNPESIVEQDGYIYGIDLYQGIVWRYATNGQFSISDYKAKRFFNDIGRNLFPINRKQTRVYGYFDREYGKFGMSFMPNDYFKDGLNIEFAEGKNRWNNFNDYVGEWHHAVGDKFVSFKDGDIFVHNAIGAAYCNFFGFEYKARVKFVSNNGPRAVKNWWNLQIQADNQWSAPYIYAPKSYSYPNGMLSELAPTHFSVEEGIWKADFLRDKTDPDPRFNLIVNLTEREIRKLLNGRVLRGEILIIELELVNSSQFSVLRRVDVEHTLSMDTKA